MPVTLYCISDNQNHLALSGIAVSLLFWGRDSMALFGEKGITYWVDDNTAG